MKISIKGWGDFQHYKERNPPWIKLHKKLLDNYQFHCLHVASKALAPLLWLLASESNTGSIDKEPEEICFRLRMTKEEFFFALNPLITSGFVIVEQDASEVLADCKRDAMPETEREKELEKETEKKPRAKRALFDPLSIDLPVCIDPELWASWIAYRREMKFTVKERATREQVAFLAEMNTKGHNLKEIVQISVRNGWQGLFEPKKTNSTYHDSIVACGKAIFGDLSNGPIDITPTSREVDSEDFFRITG